MVRVLGFDIETSGLDFKKDHILEVGYVIKEWTKERGWAPKNLAQGSFFLWEENYPDPMPPESYQTHKISSTLLKEVGKEIEISFLSLLGLCERLNVECIIAHNGIAFDKPFILETVSSYSPLLSFFADTPWIDTKSHIQYPADCKGNSLMYLSAYHGFLNPFPHDALSDVQTMMRILSHYDFERLYQRAKEPWIRIRADVKFDGKELAKARNYQWNIPLKIWEKNIPISDYENEVKEAPFQVIKLS